MPIVLFRVDERLIHGQVVVGWGARLHPDRIVVVDDDLAASAWEQELYGMGVPPHIQTEFLGVQEARVQLPAWREGSEAVFLLTRNISTMARLAENGRLDGVDVNLGGIHHAPGRRSVLPYVYLSDAEQDELARLADAGARISARDLPSARKVGLDDLLKRA